MNEIVLSTPPARRVLPSGENATVIGSSRVPCEVLCKAPELASYTRPTGSPSPVPIRVPSGEKATETEPPNGGEILAAFLRPGRSQTYVSKSPPLARRRPSAENVSHQTGDPSAKSWLA